MLLLLLSDSFTGCDEKATGSIISLELLKLGARNNDCSVPPPSDGVDSFFSSAQINLLIISYSLKIQEQSGEVILLKNSPLEI